MKLKILISSAVILQEKEAVKATLADMRKLRLIDYNDEDLYDCADHGTFWADESKQEIINNKIRSVDWFICLIPDPTVGKATWEELREILRLHRDGQHVVISVFHPNKFPESVDMESVPDGRVPFDSIMKESREILGNVEDQYWVSYSYGDIENLKRQLNEEYLRLYYTDRVFRTQRLKGLAKPGKEITASEIYFDKNRAQAINGFLKDKYFPRNSVDGKLEEALEDEKKFIIIQGAPGSGKTRALYQLISTPPGQLAEGDQTYALGSLSNLDVVIINRDNIDQVYEFLESEEKYDSINEALSELYLVCDQVKDVFGKLRNEQLYRFFDIAKRLPNVHFIATTIPSAFDNFKNRWEDYGYNPMQDEELTKVITIPQISSDSEERELRNWMSKEYQGNSAAETIGDFIPQLNRYKQDIIKSLYEKTDDYPLLPLFLSALQITETYRYDTGLFLPVMIARKNRYPKVEPSSWDDFHRDLANTINFLIAKNVLWVRHQSGNGEGATDMIGKLHESDFSLDFDMDDEEDFIFENETFEETPISTSFTYDINEIVWEELEKEDGRRRMNREPSLLKDFRNVKDVTRSAKEFYRAFPTIVSLRRILPRLPLNDCYSQALLEVKEFISKKIKDMHPSDLEKNELLITIGMLIGRADDLAEAERFVELIGDKELQPDYNIIGELYSLAHRLESGCKPKIEEFIRNLRGRNNLHNDNVFSLTRKISFFDMTFEEAFEAVKNEDFLSYNKVETEGKDKLEVINLQRLMLTVSKKAETAAQWREIFDIHRRLHINLLRSIIRIYFSSIPTRQRSDSGEIDESEQIRDTLETRLDQLLNKYNDLIAAEDKESCYFYSIAAARRFRQALPIYKLYLEQYGTDNPRLISVALGCLRDPEFQTALRFMTETNKRLQSQGSGLSNICFNNLIREAPNIGEALQVVPYISDIQDHTLTKALSLLKSKRRVYDEETRTGSKQDPKIFYYAYSAFMRKEFDHIRISPYVIGLLFGLATTPKHERFIRDVYLKNVAQERKRELIDHSSEIVSIRLQKNYRKLEEIWMIFDTCRDHYRDNRLFINSDLYCNLIRKLRYLCKDDPESLRLQQNRLAEIIREDYPRIIRDEFFLPSLYRFFPDREIVDTEGNLRPEFIRDMGKSNITSAKQFNNLLADLLDKGFDVAWKFYEFMVKFYKDNSRSSKLRPDARTMTSLLETVSTREEFDKVMEACRIWNIRESRYVNKIFRDTVAAKREQLGIPMDNKANLHNNKDRDTNVYKIPATQDPYKAWSEYRRRTNYVIESVKKEIYLYDYISSTVFNQHLREIRKIIDDITGNKRLNWDITKKLKATTYLNLRDNLITPYMDSIKFDALSYVYLLKIAPSWDFDRWIEKLRGKKEIYRYDLTICASIAQSVEVCTKDIDLALDYFEFWEDIMYDIGYDPCDPESISETSEVTYYEGVPDYDGYWFTRSSHCIGEMKYYWNEKTRNNVIDKQVLRFIKAEKEYFKEFGIPFPDFMVKGTIIDFDKELSLLDK